MVGPLEALKPFFDISSDSKRSLNRLTVLFGLVIAGLALYAVYSLRYRVTNQNSKKEKDTPTTLKKEGDEAYGERKLSLAVSKYSEALSQTNDPSAKFEILPNYTQALLTLKQFDTAIKCCQEHLAAFSERPEEKVFLLYQLGRIYETQEKLSEAIDYYNQAQSQELPAENCSLHETVLIASSYVHRKNRDYPTALALCKKVTTSSIYRVLAHHCRSWILLDQGKLLEAEEECKIAYEKVDLSDNHSRALILILQAHILNEKGEFLKALAVLAENVPPLSSEQIISFHLAKAFSHYKLHVGSNLIDCIENYSAAMALVRNDEVLTAFILYNKALVHEKLNAMNSAQLCLTGARSSRFKDQPFDRDLLRFMLEPLVEKEVGLLPAQILEERIQQKQQELQKLKKTTP